jgi:RNA polymerase sigma factor (TIGR02999 family)
MASSGEVTILLAEARKGNREAFDRLVPLVYGELREIAARYLRQERSLQTLQPTALVHEAYMRLVEHPAHNWQNRAHFLAIAALQMRRILVDRARARLANKRGGEMTRVEFEEALAVPEDRDEMLLDLDAALDGLHKRDPHLARLVELRYFGGLTIKETAEVLGVSDATVERDWAIARAWLKRELAGGQSS